MKLTIIKLLPFSTSIEAPKLLPMFPAYYIFNSLLSLLLILHVFWTWLILRIAYNAFYAGQVSNLKNSKIHYNTF